MGDVIHNSANSRFEIVIGGATAKLEYTLDGERMIIHHTFVPTELRGQNIAGKLAAAAFDYSRNEGLKVVPQCSYIEVYAKRHPEVADLMA
jgi:hypothetical protein